MTTTVGEPYQLRTFCMRFAHAAEMREIPTELADKQMMKLMAQYDHEQIWRPRIDDRPVDPTAPTRAPMPDWAVDALDGENAPAQAQWFAAMRKQLVASLAFAEHCTIDHPVACLHVAASSQQGPVTVFNQLFTSANMPASLKEGMADYNLIKAYVLLHDASAGADDGGAGERHLQEIRAAHGKAACQLLSLNTRDLTKGQPLPDLWTSLRPPDFHAPADAAPPSAEAAAGIGLLLSDADLNEVRKFVCGPLTRLVVGHLQQRVMQINATVKAARQGVKNMVRSWLGTKKGPEPSAQPAPSASSTSTSGAPRYTANTIEAQLRQLADYAFLLRDYATALANYRAAGAEFKGDKAWRHYAGTLEMAALCLFFTEGGGSRRDMEDSLEKATAHFLRGSAARHASKATLLSIDLLKRPPTKGSKADALRAGLRDAAAGLVAQSTHESHLMAALLLEQSALCYRTMRPQLPRKFAFHLILAGFRFIQCGQRRHAVRAYAAALEVYSRKGWTHIEDHVHFTLGRNCATLGKVELALQFFLRLLGHSRQPADRQTTFMKEFNNILRINPQHAQLPQLPLPRFSNRSLRVLLNDSRHVQTSSSSGQQSQGQGQGQGQAGGADSLSANNKLWRALVAPLLPAAEGGGGNWLQKSAAAKKDDATTPCVLGEWVYVEVDVENPMHIALQLHKLTLVCAHTPLPDAEATAQPFELDEHALTLQPGKRAVVRLGVRAHAEGELLIEGASWTLHSLVHGRHDFTLHGRRLNETRKQRMAKEYAFEQSLRLPVVGPHPLLQASISGMPSSLLLGQLVLARVELTNAGRTPLTSLRLRLSHPAFCVVGEEPPEPTAGDAAKQAAAALDGLLGKGAAGGGAPAAEPPAYRERDAPPPTADWSTLTLPLPGGELQPGQSVSLPLWVRAASAGRHALHFVFCYEATAPSKLLKRRLCPLSAQLLVEPSLELRHFLRPAHTCASEESYVLGVSLLNASSRAAGARLLPTQVSCVAPAWQMAPLTAAGQRPELLAPGEEFSFYFSLKRRAAPAASAVAGAAAAAAPTSFMHSELGFGQSAVDTRVTPYASFLLRDGVKSTTSTTINEKERHMGPLHEARSRANRAAQKPGEAEKVSLIVHFQRGADAVDAKGGRAGAKAEAAKAEPPKSDGGGGATPLCGQLHLTGLQPRPPPPPQPAAGGAKQPKPAPPGAKPAPAAADKGSAAWAEAAGGDVQLWAECERDMAHDFGAEPICEIDVKLHVRNTSRSTHLAFGFEAGGTGAPSRSADAVPTGSSPLAGVPAMCTPGGQYAWIGLTQLQSEWLAPGGHAVLPLRAAVLGPGVYLIDSYRVSLTAWRTATDAPEQAFSPPVACSSPRGTAVYVSATKAP